MIEVHKISYFSANHYINAFTGKKYDESIQKEKDWALEHLGKIELVSYYKQKTFGRSILVEYKRSDDENN